jgi:hypothetical protein
MQRNDFCGVHTRHEPRLTINDDPVTLIHALGRGSGNCWAIKNDGERCTYSTGPISVICGQHQSVDDPNLIQEADLRGPDDEEDRGAELNKILIAQALGRLEDVDVDLEDLPTDHD